MSSGFLKATSKSAHYQDPHNCLLGLGVEALSCQPPNHFLLDNPHKCPPLQYNASALKLFMASWSVQSWLPCWAGFVQSGQPVYALAHCLHLPQSSCPRISHCAGLSPSLLPFLPLFCSFSRFSDLFVSSTNPVVPLKVIVNPASFRKASQGDPWLHHSLVP